MMAAVKAANMPLNL